MTSNAALQGQRTAESQSHLGWLIFGTLFGIVSPFFAHIMTPTAPASVLKAGPSDPPQQQVFMDAYIGRAKNLRVRNAWIGFVLSFFFYTAACVACGFTLLDSAVPTQ